jgi:uncharacterized protein
MLTRGEALTDYDFQTGRVLPDRLTQPAHRHYLHYAQRMLAIYRAGTGKTRRELHRAVQSVFAAEPDCPQRRIAAFAKLLDDVSAYDRDRRGRAVDLRKQVFRLAGNYHPLVQSADRLFESGEAKTKTWIAAKLGRPWKEIDRDLFADVIEFHRLLRFDGYDTPAALLSRYNVAQVQAALYDAASMTVWATEDFKTILRYAKLARLMHSITRLGDGRYRLKLDGPTSVMRQTRRYGVNMARFLPALIACRGWQMHAVIRTRWSGRLLALDLAVTDGLTSHLPPPETFDSQVEEAFVQRWGDASRDGWTLVREGEILHRGQKTFLPDFVFQHDDGRRVLMEIVGFWTPEYLEAKLQTLREFQDRRILLAVAASVGASLPELPPNAITYKTALRVQDVLERLRQFGGATSAG